MSTDSRTSAPRPLPLAQALSELPQATQPLRVEGSAAELGRHFAQLADAVSAGQVQSLSLTDQQALPLRREDFLAHPQAFASTLDILTHRPIRVQFH